MGKINQIISEIEQLTPEELTRLRAWIEELEARRFDERIERDAKSGRLDELAKKALDDHAKGLSREI